MCEQPRTLNQLSHIHLGVVPLLSCVAQALVNIVYSFSQILGSECAADHAHPVTQLFINTRKEAIMRLRATQVALQTQQSWIHQLPGGFNEQGES